MKREISSEESIIDALASHCGIESEYVDNWGNIRPTSLDAKKKVLHAMGIPVTNRQYALEALRVLTDGDSSGLTEPSIVAYLHSPPKALFFKTPADVETTAAGEARVRLTITDEQGRKDRLSYSEQELTLLDRDSKHRRWSLPFPELGHLGYYEFTLSVKMGGLEQSQTIRVAMCPEKAYMPTSLRGEGRCAGISLSLYGVRSRTNWGVGDFGDLKQIVDWVVEDLHGDIIGLNPLHATFNRSPFNLSPYLPITKFYNNYIYLDILSMEDYQDSPGTKKMVEKEEMQKKLSELRGSEKVRYEEVAVLKMEVLRSLFRTFVKNHWNKKRKKTVRKRQMEEYIEREGLLLENFSTFCALESFIRSQNPDVWIWPQWPREFQRPDTEAVRQFKRDYGEEVLFYKYVQWQLEEQLAQVQEYAKSRGMSVGLYHDLALATDRFGADFWAYQDNFVSGATVGAPPDAFSQNGQDWGFPPPKTERFLDTGYDLFVKEIRKNCAFGGAMRIDHVMRFFHLYVIPEGESPETGAYVSQPHEDMVRLLALESIRNKVVIVGEDLGTVPEYIRERLREADIFSYRLLYFERDDRQDFLRPERYPELALVTVSTHDLPTLAGYWKKADMELRKRAGLFHDGDGFSEAVRERERDKIRLLKLAKEMGLLEVGGESEEGVDGEMTGEVHNAIVGLLALTPSKLFVLSQEDLLKDDNQQNLPGTTSEYPNWSNKMKYGAEELRTDPEARAFSGMFRAWIDRCFHK